jgi:hypothetical protein
MELIHGAFASGSGPNVERERNAAYHIMYEAIRQRIEAFPETCSKGDVLKVLDECKQALQTGKGGGLFVRSSPK